MNSNKARASLREIPEDVSVRNPPLKKKKRGGKRTLTLENDDVVVNDEELVFCLSTLFDSPRPLRRRKYSIIALYSPHEEEADNERPAEKPSP